MAREAPSQVSGKKTQKAPAAAAAAKASDSVSPSESNEYQTEKSVKLAQGLDLRANYPGTRTKDWNRWSHIAFEEMDTPMAAQMWIQQCIREDASNVERILQAPEGQCEVAWKYEHARQLLIDLNRLIAFLLDECSDETCETMAADQWNFLCAAHGAPKECSAPGYMMHTMDQAQKQLTLSRYFPSRVNIKDSQLEKLPSLCRRVYRVFIHAYFSHRKMYQEYEAKHHICRRFTMYVKKYKLMSLDTLMVPVKGETDEKYHLNTDPASSKSRSVNVSGNKDEKGKSDTPQETDKRKSDIPIRTTHKDAHNTVRRSDPGPKCSAPSSGPTKPARTSLVLSSGDKSNCGEESNESDA